MIVSKEAGHDKRTSAENDISNLRIYESSITADLLRKKSFMAENR